MYSEHYSLCVITLELSKRHVLKFCEGGRLRGDSPTRTTYKVLESNAPRAYFKLSVVLCKRPHCPRPHSIWPLLFHIQHMSNFHQRQLLTITVPQMHINFCTSFALDNTTIQSHYLTKEKTDHNTI